MARHAAPRNSPAARTLLRAGLTLGAAGAALAAGTAAATAAPTDADGRTKGTKLNTTDVPTALDTVTGLPLNPLAGTGVDPLNNGVETQVADFKPVSTTAVTGPLSQGASLSELPVVGDVTRGAAAVR